ncbi:MAG: GTP pyrophosphokinase family protein [Lachnospiraceae bacterium]|nr:GTP pyrophosphokinase family protein [Lachnospiraceae bacterium]
MAKAMNSLKDEIDRFRKETMERDLDDPVDHVLARIKDEDSMIDKLSRKKLPINARSALCEVHDAIGIRIVCPFINDVYAVSEYLRSRRDLEIVLEKDYIKQAKENGYRSLHMIIREKHGFFAEVQIRTISMDTWAALEHAMRYKHDIGGNTELIARELKRCADELASTDLSLQTIRDMIRQAK